jgi:hypothetical protein
MFILKIIMTLRAAAFEALRLYVISALFYDRIPLDRYKLLAAHEAGHALLSYQYGVCPYGVIVYKRDNWCGVGGTTYMNMPMSLWNKPKKQIAILAAGVIGAEIAGCAEPNYGDDSDMRRIAELVCEHGLTDEDVIDAYTDARRILKAYSRDLLALADAIAQREFLDSADIRRVLEATR